MACIPTSMEYVANLLTNKNQHLLDYYSLSCINEFGSIKTFGLTHDELPNFVGYFFNISDITDYQSIKQSILNNHLILGTMKVENAVAYTFHEVVIIGYQSTAPNKLICIDPYYGNIRTYHYTSFTKFYRVDSLKSTATIN